MAKSNIFIYFYYFFFLAYFFPFIFLVIQTFVSEKREFQERVPSMSQTFLSGDSVHTTAGIFSDRPHLHPNLL